MVKLRDEPKEGGEIEIGWDKYIKSHLYFGTDKIWQLQP
jgi:hypothetical protein